MVEVAGFNPMRWNCAKDGCFNQKRRPKIEVFADCFPRRINFGDVDGLVELNGKFLMLEWKGDGGSIRTGQARSFSEFTSTIGNLVLVVRGNAETMKLDGYSSFWGGRSYPYISAGLEDLKERIRRWVQWTEEARSAA